MLNSLTVTILAEDSVGYETPFLGQHGVSFLLEARSGELVRRVLVDVAQLPQPLLHNMAILDIDPTTIDAIVLTHCHYDHTQGLTEIVRAVGNRDLPVIAHPDIFRPNFETVPTLRHIGVMNSDTREAITAAGGMFFPVRDPLQLLPGLTTSGEVPRTTAYENRETNLKTIRDGRVEVDPMIDELSVYATVQGVGTVVVTGCSHAGVVNIARHARTVAGTQDSGGTGDGTRPAEGNTALAGSAQVAAIIGGFHLIEADAERIRKTVADLHTEGVGHIYAGHCTGFPAQAALYSTFGDAFTPLRTGQQFTFSQ
ncbi:MAG: MBL fold metallo-hydrolase [Spirochaeta sp.]|jgi:7,8-dihydropterin-6-yl-methyl-4-(beta-D-ribofuranosyl)aminobenzene 5'-phosphate synthase|nr:MBL fold metallo-hydrolase [Spirochaeta sp.]